MDSMKALEVAISQLESKLTGGEESMEVTEVNETREALFSLLELRRDLESTLYRNELHEFLRYIEKCCDTGYDFTPTDDGDLDKIDFDQMTFNVEFNGMTITLPTSPNVFHSMREMVLEELQ